MSKYFWVSEKKSKNNKKLNRKEEIRKIVLPLNTPFRIHYILNDDKIKLNDDKIKFNAYNDRFF